MSMTLTPFGVAVRKARIDLEMSLKDMADATGVSSSFLSAIENGRKLLNDPLYAQIEKLLKQRGLAIPDMRVLADVSNKKVSLKGLSNEQARLVSTLAHTKLTTDLATKLKALLFAVKKPVAGPSGKGAGATRGQLADKGI